MITATAKGIKNEVGHSSIKELKSAEKGAVRPESRGTKSEQNGLGFWGDKLVYRCDTGASKLMVEERSVKSGKTDILGLIALVSQRNEKDENRSVRFPRTPFVKVFSEGKSARGGGGSAKAKKLCGGFILASPE